MKTRDELCNEIQAQQLTTVHKRTDRLFAALLVAQWVFAVGLAVGISPFSWDGASHSLHPHVVIATCFGLVINSLPLALVRFRPGWWGTRHMIAIAQMLWSAVLIHITGGRIETHFHIFGSLAFLAMYFDWKVLLTATAVVIADHLSLGFLMPESVYGIPNPEWWLVFEHAGWVVFEDIVLVLGCLRGVAHMRVVADREARLAVVNGEIEQRVAERTEELSVANAAIAREMTTRLQMETELRQAQKLESVGRLAAGVAHEINTPVQFVGDSIYFLRDATKDLLGVMGSLQTVNRSVLAGTPDLTAAHQATAAEESADLEYLMEHIPKAFERSLDGLERVATIVSSMKAFAHPDHVTMAAVDLNASIQSTLVIANNEIKYVADLVTSYGELPLVGCHAGEINQCVLNIVLNAAHAIGDRVAGTEDRGTITVTTRLAGAYAEISIADTGGGIPDAIRDQIFDPFFTTKEVGNGTGQGLAITRTVVVEKHGGTIEVDTELGRGTTFVIRLPVETNHTEAMAA